MMNEHNKIPDFKIETTTIKATSRKLKVGWTTQIKYDFTFGDVLSEEDLEFLHDIMISIMDETGLKYKLSNELNRCTVKVNGVDIPISVTDKFIIGDSWITPRYALSMNDPKFCIDIVKATMILYVEKHNEYGKDSKYFNEKILDALEIPEDMLFGKLKDTKKEKKDEL